MNEKLTINKIKELFNLYDYASGCIISIKTFSELTFNEPNGIEKLSQTDIFKAGLYGKISNKYVVLALQSMVKFNTLYLFKGENWNKFISTEFFDRYDKVGHDGMKDFWKMHEALE